LIFSLIVTVYLLWQSLSRLKKASVYGSLRSVDFSADLTAQLPKCLKVFLCDPIAAVEYHGVWLFFIIDRAL
jgi:hypothetical protein